MRNTDLSKSRLILGFCTILCLAGCLSGRTVHPTKYYLLQPEVTVEKASASNLTLGMRPLETALPIERRMAYRTADGEVGYRSTEWAERPGDTATRAILDALSASGRFRDAGPASEMARPDLMLTGELRRFFENRGSEPHAAEIELRLELRKARDNAAVWTQTLRVMQPLKGEEASSLTEAMNGALSALVTQAVNEITGAPL